LGGGQGTQWKGDYLREETENGFNRRWCHLQDCSGLSSLRNRRDDQPAQGNVEEFRSTPKDNPIIWNGRSLHPGWKSEKEVRK
jgi:hypothetical protein